MGLATVRCKLHTNDSGLIPSPGELLPVKAWESRNWLASPRGGESDANSTPFASESQARDGDDAAWRRRVALRIIRSTARTWTQKKVIIVEIVTKGVLTLVSSTYHKQWNCPFIRKGP